MNFGWETLLEFWGRDIIGTFPHSLPLPCQVSIPTGSSTLVALLYLQRIIFVLYNYYYSFSVKRKSNNTSYLTMNRTRPTTQFSFTQKLLRATWWLLPSISYISQSMCNVMHVTNAQTVLDQVHPYMYPSLN